ncbi:MAG: hypothetical protein AAFO91_11365, partial [Bacteroidota bacterium]
MSRRARSRLSARTEPAGNADFTTILEEGAMDYPTHELHVLLRLLRIKTTQVGRIRRWSYGLGWALPISLVGASLGAMQGWREPFYGCLAFAFLCMSVIILLEWWQGRVLPVYGDA